MEIVKVYVPEETIEQMVEPLFKDNYLDKVKYIICGYAHATVSNGVFGGHTQALFVIKVVGEKATLDYGFKDANEANRKFVQIVQHRKVKQISVEKYLQEIKNKA